ncbi:cell wall integrity and stress response component 3-like [Aphidius gifuensis]|uniref:cell wall integrity and stress response component 3-like n=1 Tax=Aphidius gifuensis TaxID=684658 RepID=UPI001CDC60E4|nr:cell wall integrity and stress response component 3-like [Aphidius gifuensis]
MNNFIILILFSVSAITIAFPNTENEENNLNYQTRNLDWCQKFCTLHKNYHHDNKVSISLMKIKCKLCNKYYHLTTSLAPNLMVQTSTATAAATAASTTTTTTTLATTKSIATIKPVIENTKSTIQQTTVTSTTPIAPSSTTLSTTTTTTAASTTSTSTVATTSTSTAATTSATATFATTTISAALKNNIQMYLNKAQRALDSIMDYTMSVERMKNKIIMRKNDMLQLEEEIKMTDGTSLADMKYEGEALKDNIVDQSDQAETAKQYVSSSKNLMKNYLESAKREAAKVNLDISAKIQKQMDNLDKALKKFDNEYKIIKDEEMEAIAIYNKIDKLMN